MTSGHEDLLGKIQRVAGVEVAAFCGGYGGQQQRATLLTKKQIKRGRDRERGERYREHDLDNYYSFI
jgi:hypothetical protein